ncbi:proton-conducting transporter membrane subunit [Marispirochaeta sp.]|uniref:complex I subunit 5 family protein n=1 Tax=Marispirochaeta sp. TaxID=2038653 RepID=UPI0029C6C7A8|nr:proton-conducting transporter membrane subunit [Marispirochaeta sp.]
MTENLVIWILVSPLFGAALALFGKIYKAVERIFCYAAVLSFIGPIFALVLLCLPVMEGTVYFYSLGGWAEPYGISLVLDGFAWVSSALISLITPLIALFALGNRKYGAHFYFFLMLLTGGMYGVALTGDLFTMFVGFEIIAIAVYVLIAYEGTPTGLVASFKYLMLSTTGILFFLFGIFLVYRDLGVLSITRISALLQSAGGVRNTPTMHLALASLCVGIGVRTAFIPFHTWLPEAHAYAPHPVSALLSGVLIKVSFFAMVRILIQFGGGYMSQLLLWIGAVTAISAVISALAQSDAKRLLAYHSISQMGYILAVFGAGSSFALTASFFHALNHALFKSLLFLTVGTAVGLSGVRNLYKISGLGRRVPLFGLTFFVGALSISGIPPFNGFASKAYISSGMDGSPAYALLWITSFLTIASFIKLSRIYFPGLKARHPAAQADQAVVQDYLPGKLENSVVILLALLCLGTGVFGIYVARFLHRLLYSEALRYTLPLFGWDKLLSVLPAVILGAAVFRLVMTSAGKRFSSRLKALAPDLHTVLIFFFIGLLAFAAAAY